MIPQPAEQINILLHWYVNFCNDKRSLFLGKLADILANENDPLAVLIASLSISTNVSKSVIECQLTMFENWYANWDQLTKSHFVNELANLDCRVKRIISRSPNSQS